MSKESNDHRFNLGDKVKMRVRVDAYTGAKGDNKGVEFPELNVGDKCEVMGFSVKNVVWVMFENNPQFRLIHEDHLDLCEE